MSHELVIVEKEVAILEVSTPGPQGPAGPGGEAAGNIITRNLTVSPLDPSGGADGDLWFKYQP